MNFPARVGHSVIDRTRRSVEVAAAALAVCVQSARPRTWRRTVREALARQILFSGVEAIHFVSMVALVVGVVVVVQYQMWLGQVIRSQLLGPILVIVIVRELGPLLTNFLVIARSGNAMASELGIMRINGEVRALDAQGLDPFIYLVIPRVIGMTIATACLTVLFIAVALASGYVCGTWVGVRTGGFLETVLGSMDATDILNVCIKGILPPLVSGVICCIEGLNVGDALTDVPQAAMRGMQRSVVALFVTSGTVTILTYL